MAGLWRNDPDTPECKYLVKRRDGTVPQWPWFVLAASDASAPAALRAYADDAGRRGLDPQYVADIRQEADAWDAWRLANGAGDPDAPRHRVDDPATVAEMRAAMERLMGEVDRRDAQISLLRHDVAELGDRKRDVRGLNDEVGRLEAALAALRDAIAREHEEICQVLGKALGYSRYADDPASVPEAAAKGDDAVCVGEHVALSLAGEAAARIGKLTEMVALHLAEAQGLRAALDSETGAHRRVREARATGRAELDAARNRLAALADIPADSGLATSALVAEVEGLVGRLRLDVARAYREAVAAERARDADGRRVAARTRLLAALLAVDPARDDGTGRTCCHFCGRPGVPDVRDPRTVGIAHAGDCPYAASLRLEAAAPAPLGVTPDVARKLLAIREAMTRGDRDEAWHQLYAIADPTFSTTYGRLDDPADQGPWNAMIALAASDGRPAADERVEPGEPVDVPAMEEVAPGVFGRILRLGDGRIGGFAYRNDLGRPVTLRLVRRARGVASCVAERIAAPRAEGRYETPAGVLIVEGSPEEIRIEVPYEERADADD